jgi:hypothetical protein
MRGRGVINKKINSGWDAVQATRFIGHLRARLTTLMQDDPDEEVIRDTIEGEIDLEAICNRLLEERGSALAKAACFKALASKYAEYASVAAARADRYDTYLLEAMLAARQQKVACDLGTISVAQGRMSTKVVDEAKLPPWFFKSTPDVVKVKAAIEKGETVPGAEVVRGPDYLTIRLLSKSKRAA